MFVNKYDSFRVTDTNPINVKFLSFSGYETAPTEFYFNCSSSKRIHKSQPLAEKIKTPPINETFVNSADVKKIKLNPESIEKKFQSNDDSITNFGLLVLCTINMVTNMIQLYCMYLFSKYLDS